MAPFNQTQDFLFKHQLFANQYNTESIVASFLDEMERGLAGSNSSLAMIPSFIPIPTARPANEKIIVLDAGGTNFRTTLITFDAQNKPHQEYFSNNPMPGMRDEISKEAFFDKIVDYIEPVIHASTRLGFCFSYPMTIDSQRDGTLLYWTKEIKAPQVVGKKILVSVREALRRRGLPCPQHMLIINDTVASLLAGLAWTNFSSDYNYVGFILGTGSNTAYIEKNSNIIKQPGLPKDQSMAINCESSNFNKISRGDIDIAFDRTTSNPGQYVLEKMLSGSYLGNLCFAILLTAANEGVISKETFGKINAIPDFTTPFLDTILSGSLSREPTFHDCASEDLESIHTIISEVVERAALLSAINMTAPVIKHIKSNSILKKFCISADGSIYYRLHGFKERAEKYVAKIIDPYEVEYTIVQADDAPIIGTAVAGLV